MLENQIIEKAITKLQQLTNLPIQVLNKHLKTKANLRPDAEIKIDLANKSYSFLVEAKSELRQIHLSRIIQYFSNEPQNWLLISQYISKPNREILRNENINYLDVSGNCYINKNSLFLYINDQKVTEQRKPKTSKLWNASGLRLVFAILVNPDLINEPYRVISNQSKLALGAVGALIKELETENYIIAYSNKYHLENREALLNRWIETYNAILKPKLITAKFRFATPNDRANWQQKNTKAMFWGGEPAGAILTNYLHPQKFTLYTEVSKFEVMKTLHLVPDANGEVEVLKPFWNTEQIHNGNNKTVHPLLAYTELFTSLDSRNRETAMKIKEQFNL